MAISLRGQKKFDNNPKISLSRAFVRIVWALEVGDVILVRDIVVEEIVKF